MSGLPEIYSGQAVLLFAKLHKIAYCSAEQWCGRRSFTRIELSYCPVKNAFLSKIHFPKRENENKNQFSEKILLTRAADILLSAHGYEP